MGPTATGLGTGVCVDPWLLQPGGGKKSSPRHHLRGARASAPPESPVPRPAVNFSRVARTRARDSAAKAICEKLRPGREPESRAVARRGYSPDIRAYIPKVEAGASTMRLNYLPASSLALRVIWRPRSRRIRGRWPSISARGSGLAGISSFLHCALSGDEGARNRGAVDSETVAHAPGGALRPGGAPVFSFSTWRGASEPNG